MYNWHNFFKAEAWLFTVRKADMPKKSGWYRRIPSRRKPNRRPGFAGFIKEKSP
jgi:hypothetical protein